MVEQQMPDAVAQLQRYCRQPSISAQGVGIEETIAIVVDMVERAGGTFRVLDDCGGNPVIFAEFMPGPHGNLDRCTHLVSSLGICQLYRLGVVGGIHVRTHRTSPFDWPTFNRRCYIWFSF